MPFFWGLIYKMNFLLSLVLITAGVLKAETLRLLSTGEESLAARIASIKSANKKILIETFYLENDPVGHLILHELLEKKKKSPEIKIRILTDAWGSGDLSRESMCLVRSREIQWRIFNPVKKTAPFKSQIRDHRKIWITENSAIVGGRNLSEENLKKDDWDVEIKGEILTKIENSFEDMWEISEDLDCHEIAPSLPEKPKRRLPELEIPWHEGSLEWLSDVPFKNKVTTPAVLSQIKGARNTLLIETGYFSPDKTFMKALFSSSADVALIVNAPWTGYWMQELATCASLRYQKILKDSHHVEILYPKRGNSTHGKLIVSDEEVLGIGSFNLHEKSISHNAETWLLVKESPTLMKEVLEKFQARRESATRFRSIGDEDNFQGFSALALKRCKLIEKTSPIVRPFI
jgi:cardiolipin synthase